MRVACRCGDVRPVVERASLSPVRTPTGTAAGIEELTLVRFDHFDKQSNDATGREELAAELAFSRRKLVEEVFVDSTENVFRTSDFVANRNRADQVEPLAEAGLSRSARAKRLGRTALSRGLSFSMASIAPSTYMRNFRSRPARGPRCWTTPRQRRSRPRRCPTIVFDGEWAKV